MKIWYLISILFCFYCVNILNDERYEVTYVQKKNEKEDEIHYLGCQNLNNFGFNETEVNLNQLKNYIYDYFVEINEDLKRKDLNLFEELILNKIKSGNYLIWKDRFCLIGNNRKELEDIQEIQELQTREKKLQFVAFAFKKNTFELFKLKRRFDHANQLIVQNEEYPYSKCRNKNHFKFRCLNDCFKKVNNRLSKYYYDGNETGLIYLDYDENSQSILTKEMNCFNQCEEEDCKFTYLSPTPYSKKSDSKFFQAIPIVSKLDYWMQLIGLILLFVGTCFYELISKSIDFMMKSIDDKIFIILKIQKDKIKRSLFYLEIFILFVSLIFILYFFIDMIINYENNKKNPIKKETSINFLEPEIMNLVFCIHLTETYENKTLLNLEKDTDITVDEEIDEIYLDYQNKKVETHWTKKPKVLFKYYDVLSRCFQIEVYPKEPKYQRLLSISKLIIKFKSTYNSLFLLVKNENFNSKSYKKDEDYAFVKKVIKRSSNCIHYEETYLNCKSQWNCIDRCINRKLFEKYENITGFKKVLKYEQMIPIIDKDHFTGKEWSEFYLNSNNLNYSFYNETKYECTQKYSRKSCNEIKFESSVKIYMKYSILKEIDLYYDVIKIVDEEQSWYKLLLDMLNIQSIFFGLTFFKLAQIIYNLIRTKLKINDNKIYIFIIYLICSFGFMTHIYHIFSLIINGDLTESQHYEILDSIQMPDIIFCFDIDQKLIDKNYKLTGNYLEEVTVELNTDKIFENISYLNKLNEWVDFKFNSTDRKFEIEEFYFAGRKCFNLKLKVEYQRNQFYFSTDHEVLRINFNRRFIKSKTLFFMAKTKEKNQFSKVNELNFIYDSSYVFSNEEFSVTLNDKFNLIKNPLSLFYGENDLNDVNEYLNRLMNNKFNLKSLNLPIKKEHYEIEIDDDLFEQFFNQIQNVTDFNTPANLNYKREYIINHLQRFYYNFEANFVSRLVFFKKVIKITNKDNYAKLILNLLNSSSIWFELKVFDLHLHIYKIKQSAIFTYKFLLKIKKNLYSLLRYPVGNLELFFTVKKSLKKALI